MKNPENQIQEIKERNKRVEIDKAWETSKTRSFFILLLTYMIAMIFMWQIGISNPELNALVPTGGYFLSTLSLPKLKSWWIKNIYKKNG